MTQGFEVQRINQNDIDPLFDLVREFAASFPTEREAYESSFHFLIANPSVELWGAKQGNELVGYVMAFHHLTFFANGKVTWIEELMVKKEFRRRGIGEALVHHIEKRAKEVGSKLVALATRRAEDFYLAIKYEDSAKYFRKRL